ncbi:fumarate/nitrate reduction transcriptional regulator Fnr [Thalassotalea sp. 1_MG-2023]|uniref:fumarate/nitrate reduction transcriptional regulator Fnr n=1 Tax=Thalassotalea sp. 1_MG-2023 TaxID=3062680 RepID=UPI0026E1B0F0|nr:fumarate/nitrate reduction transcriptional regulator Fnr [Thalassotalea sp. 1_MG-2023]MDO6427780.1 fumarate/nitrate reduction transcriptional regulator Fnr [Thalassotalea sp. 1_MG-2023]
MNNQHCPGQQHIHCQSCSLSELCLPFSLNEHELQTLDNIINRKRPIHKGEQLFHDGDKMKSLYAVRSGTFKTFTINENGEAQITGFHLAGDLLGFEAIALSEHSSFATALETSMVCEIPYETLDTLSNSMPKLKKQILRMMSSEIKTDQAMLTLLNRKNAEQRLATFLSSLSKRYQERNLSPTEFRLTMTRSDIGNYIGLTVETISRLLNRFHKNNIIVVNGKLITIVDIDKLNACAAL